MLHVETASLSSSRSDIEDRLTGRFYTPYPIVEALACYAVQVGCPESVCDPFCGDGRLIVGWLRHQGRTGSLNRLKKITLWDLDAKAVDEAEKAVSKELSRQRVNWVSIDTAVGDTFTRPLEPRFELVLTNPPWEQLKPDSRDGVGEADRYRKEIKAYTSEVTKLLPEAAAYRKRTIGGYTVNLARAGALAAVRLTRENGLLSVVLPSTIFADQVSAPFRRRLFSDISVQDITFYPAEARLFSGVDQSFVTVNGRVGRPTSSFCIQQMHPDLTLAEARQHTQTSTDAPLPLAVGGTEHALIGELQDRHPNLGWLEGDLRFGLRLGRELDETRIAETFVTEGRGVPFLKGRNISRFGFDPSKLPGIDPRKRKIPPSVDERRVAWRDVSRPSQRRRMHACIIPAGYVTGNSLGIGRLASPMPDLLETLLAVMNSFVFEIQVRSRLATNHVSQGVMRSCAIPYALFEDTGLRAIIAKVVSGGVSTLSSAVFLEVAIAKAYGLSRSEFASLLRPFNKLSENEIGALVSKESWS